MKEFCFYNPVKIYFGAGALQNLTKELPTMGKRILLTYGGGSIRRNGIYDDICRLLTAAGKEVYELSGILANPRTAKVDEGVKICRDKGIDFILAAGGGSVIDCSKAIATVAKLPEGTDYWEKLFVRKEETTEAIPLGCILTIPATGSEMNTDCVITNWEKQLKYSYSSVHQYPRFSILDPEYTYTLPREQMIYGAIDTLSHIFEIYFSTPDENNVSDDVAEALMKNVIVNLNRALEDPEDPVARSNLMWDSTMALNGIIEVGKDEDWMAHKIEHALSAFYDIPHGAGLAVCQVPYLDYICEEAPEKFARYAVRIMECDPAGKTDTELAHEGLAKTKEYFRRIGAPVTLGEVEIPQEAIPDIAAKTLLIPGSYKRLQTADVEQILRNCR